MTTPGMVTVRTPLGIPPALGRWFSQKDDLPGSAPTMILSYGWFEQRFGGDPSVIGRQIMVDGVSREVIGVMPVSFRFLDQDPAFVAPLQFDRSKAFLGQFAYPGIARLKPGVTIQQASADIARMIPIALHSFPPQTGLTVKVFEDAQIAPKLRFLRRLHPGLASSTGACASRAVFELLQSPALDGRAAIAEDDVIKICIECVLLRGGGGHRSDSSRRGLG